MADNKLFYNLSENNAGRFKTDKQNEKVIGLVKPVQGSPSTFGYLISGGQQYGASYVDITNIASKIANTQAQAYSDIAYTTAKQYANDKLKDYAKKSEIKDIKPNGTGSFTVNGAEYTISFNDKGTISVNKYVPTTVSRVEVPTLNATKTETGGGTFYVGYTYNIRLGINFHPETTQSIYAAFDNETRQPFNIKIYNGQSYFYNFDVSEGLSSHTISYNVKDVMSNVTYTTYQGTVTANTSYTASVSTSGEKTFTVIAYDGKTTNSLSKKQTQITAYQTVTPKTIFAYGVAENRILDNSYIVQSYIGSDNKFVFCSSGDYTGTNKPKSVTINEGTPIVIFHKSLGTPTFKQLGAPDTSWKKLRDEHVSGVVNDSAGNGKIYAPAEYVIYQHTHTNDQGTWEITWAK